MHVSDFSCTWLIYNLNTNCCYSQITCMRQTCTHRTFTMVFSMVNPPLLSSLAFSFPFALINRSLYLLGDPSFDDSGANIHPLSSLVSYQLSLPCCLTHPVDTPQIKLHVYIDDITTSAALSDTVTMSKITMWPCKYHCFAYILAQTTDHDI